MTKIETTEEIIMYFGSVLANICKTFASNWYTARTKQRKDQLLKYTFIVAPRISQRYLISTPTNART